MAFTSINRFPRISRRGWIVVLAALLGTAYASSNILSWRFAVVGDEWAFFHFAKGIAERKLLANPFAINGVYNEERVLPSYIQAIFLFLFGKNFFVWKLSGTFFILPVTIIFYKYIKRFFGKEPALIGAVLIAFSKYYLNYFKIGYPFPLCVFLFVLTHYFALRLVHKASFKYALLCGLGFGLSFFSYLGPVFPVVFAPYIYLLFRKKGSRGWTCFWIVVAVFLFFIGLGLLSTPSEYWLLALKKTSAHREFSDNKQFFINVIRNFQLYFRNFDYIYWHFVDGAYLDVVTRCAAAAGIILAVFKIRRKEGVLLFLWISLCVVLGFINPYWYTPSNRGIMFIPYGIAFAAIGFHRFVQMVPWSRARHTLVAIFLAAAIGLNIYEAEAGYFSRQGFKQTAMIWREVLHHRGRPGAVQIYYSLQYSFDPQFINQLQSAQKVKGDVVTVTREEKELCPPGVETLILFKDDPAVTAGGLIEKCLEKNNNVQPVLVSGNGY